LVKRLILFATISSIIGGFAIALPRILFDFGSGMSDLISFLTFAKAVGSSSVAVGFMLHMAASALIGIFAGIFFQYVIKVNFSKIKKGLASGLFTEGVAFVVLYIPLSLWVLAPSLAEILVELDPEMTFIEASEMVEQARPFKPAILIE